MPDAPGGTVFSAGHSPNNVLSGSAGLENSKESDLYVGLRVVRVGRAHLAEYAPKGLTAAMLDALAASAAEFLELLGKQQDAETARGRAADVRIVAGNALYEELVDLCGIGKARYATTDARQYADYVVTDAPAAPAAPVLPQA